MKTKTNVNIYLAQKKDTIVFVKKVNGHIGCCEQCMDTGQGLIKSAADTSPNKLEKDS
jgi:hypothetical protein